MSKICDGLIISIGKTWEPIVYSLKELKPKFVAFLCTPDSCSTLDKVLIEYPMSPSHYRIFLVADDPQAIGEMVNKFYEAYRWQRQEKGLEPSSITIDPTPGRKWMSSAVTMLASYLGANMAYIDVSFKEGSPDPSTMRIVNLGNAYDQTGFLETERGIQFFNSGAWENAKDTFEKIQSHDSSLNDLATGLAKLSELMKKWDLFLHYKEDLSYEFAEVLKYLKRAAFSDPSRRFVIRNLIFEIERFQKMATQMYAETRPNLYMILDLFLNAERCIWKGRYDDGVARLYRVLEALAQYYLKKDYNLNTSSPDFSAVKQDVVKKFQNYKSGKLPDKIGLEDDYVFLHLAGHPQLANEIIKGVVGGRAKNIFYKYIHGRNNSILAHGFEPIEKGLAEDFLKKTEELLIKVLKEKYHEFKDELKFPYISSMFGK